MTTPEPEQIDREAQESERLSWPRQQEELGLLYNYTSDDSRQFTRYQMMVAIAHGYRLGIEQGKRMAGGDATDILSGLSSYLGAGLGDDKTTAREFDDRIRWGIDHMICAVIQRCADVVEECSKRPNTGWGQLKKRILDLKPEYEASITATRAALTEQQEEG